MISTLGKAPGIRNIYIEIQSIARGLGTLAHLGPRVDRNILIQSVHWIAVSEEDTGYPLRPSLVF